MINLNLIPCPEKGFIARQLGDEMVFVSGRGDELHNLNDIGTFIWSNIDGKKTLNDILNIICEEYDVDYDTAHTDLDFFIKQLEQKKLLSLKKG